MGDRALTLFEAGTDRDQLLRRFMAEGRLPPGPAGECALDTILERAQPIAEAMVELRAGVSPTTMNIDLELGDCRVIGTIEGVYGPRLLRHSYSKPSASRAIKLWLEHLALKCSDHADKVCESVYRGRGAGFRFGAVSDAREILERLVQVYRRGHGAPFPLFPAAAEAFAKAIRKPGTPESKGWGAARKAIGRAHGDGLAVKMAWGDLDPLRDITPGTPEFPDLAKQVFGPMLEHREDLK